MTVSNELIDSLLISKGTLPFICEAGGLLDVLQHHNPGKYSNQLVFVAALNGYVCLVPFVEEENYFFLKTIIPSRKAMRDYLKQGGPDEEA